MRQRADELVLLVPDMEDKICDMQPTVLSRICLSPRSVTDKVLRLKALLPRANVSQLLAGRPSLLLDEEFAVVPESVRQLSRMYPNQDVSALVSHQPNLLVADVENNYLSAAFNML